MTVTEMKGVSHIQRLLRDPMIPELTGELAEIPEVAEIHRDLSAIREYLYAFAGGDFSAEIQVRGVIAGALKALQANLRHLTWQVQRVEEGDFSQRVEFMGEFARAFNSMVRQLERTLGELKQKKEGLLALTRDLQSEVDLRNSVEEALKSVRERESHYKYQASHDGLTGTLNRSAFLERAGLEVRILLGQGIPCCLGMLDVDHFKEFNDTYGHVAGDEALRHIAKVITSALRKNDFMGRYGGEEFVLFISGADMKRGMVMAERIRRTLEANPVKLGNLRVGITASFGVSEITGGEDPNLIQRHITQADRALYEAKRGGRNRVTGF